MFECCSLLYELYNGHQHWWVLGISPSGCLHVFCANKLSLSLSPSLLLFHTSQLMQVMADTGAPLPSAAQLADLLQKHEVGRRAIDYRLFLTGTKYTRKSWRHVFADDDQMSKRMKLKSFPRQPAPLFICRRPRPIPGGRQSQENRTWEPPYVELRLSDVRPINVERSGHVISDDRAWYVNR